MKLNYKLFNGVSVRLDDANLDKSEASVANLMKISTVKNMWPVQVAEAASINDFQHATNKLRAPSSLPENPLPLKGAQKESKPFTRHALNTTNQPYSPHVMIQVDKLHSEGLRGKGTRIAVISSGVSITDYSCTAFLHESKHVSHLTVSNRLTIPTLHSGAVSETAVWLALALISLVMTTTG